MVVSFSTYSMLEYVMDKMEEQIKAWEKELEEKCDGLAVYEIEEDTDIQILRYHIQEKKLELKDIQNDYNLMTYREE